MTAGTEPGERIPFTKGHGTGNDFVLVPDLDGALDVTASLVAAICDRRTGLGGDGLLRIVRTANADDADIRDQADSADWFMDYRNADGSVAEMCGNGIRVFVRYLLDERLASGPEVNVATRSGVTPVRVLDDGSLSARLGPLGFPAGAELSEQPYVCVGDRRWPAMPLTMPNPHAVVFVETLTEAGALCDAPEVGPAGAFPTGANVEFVQIIEPGHLAMRVHERGVGETASCGTGACAAVAAARRHVATGSVGVGGEVGGEDGGEVGVGVGIPKTWRVDVPGGRLLVTEHADATMDLRGPAALVASGTYSPR